MPNQSHCQIPLIYLRIFQLMVENLGKKDQIVTAKTLLEFWHRQLYNFPWSKYDYHVLSEMCDYGMIERINSFKYKFFGNQAYYKLRRLNTYFLW